MADAAEQCAVCLDEFPASSLIHCFVCARQTCAGCTVNKGGHRFCSRRCADSYYFSGPDDESGQGGED